MLHLGVGEDTGSFAALEWSGPPACILHAAPHQDSPALGGTTEQKYSSLFLSSLYPHALGHKKDSSASPINREEGCMGVL